MLTVKKKKRKYIIITSLILLAIVGAAAYLKYINVSYDYSHLVAACVKEEGESFKAVSGGERLPGMSLAASNDRMSLYINEENTSIAVRDQKTGAIWYSNPVNGQQDEAANGTEKDYMASQMNVTYYDAKRNECTFTTNKDSVLKGQFEIENIQDGVRVTYTFGDLSLGADMLPKYITPERFEEKILSKVSEASAKEIKKRYVDSKNKQGFLELLESCKKSEIIINKLLGILEEAGYTEEDLAADNEASGHEMNLTREYCIIPVEYRLKDDKLLATVQTDQIEETSNTQVASIELLKYFGAADSKEEGYSVVPNGSGSLIYFNNGKGNEDNYMQNVYGNDNAIYNRWRTQVSEEARMPIFGMKESQGAFLTCIEEGDTLATINASVSGKVNSYNSAWVKFTLRNSDTMYMTGVSGGEQDMIIVEKAMYRGPLTLAYCFLEDKDATYVDMAQYYQDKLVAEGTLTALQEKEQMPFYLDLIGGIEKELFALGVPYTDVVAMTDAEEAEEIVDTLSSENINNIRIRLSGWFNNGINHNVAKKVKLEKSVANKKELNALQDKLQGLGGDLYPEVGFQLVPYEGKNYTAVKEASRYVFGQVCSWSTYNRATLRMTSPYDTAWYIVNSPNALPSQMSQFIKNYDKLGLDNIALRDTGVYLSSDKNKRRSIDRETSKLIVNEQMGKLNETRNEMMVVGGNAYTLSYADHLVDIPTESNGFYIVDESIPFYEMVIHGYIDYAGTSINMIEGYDKQETILNMIESGSAPYFTWSYKSSSEVQNTAYASYYSTCYKDWLADGVEIYNAVNEAINPVRTSKIVGHEILTEGIRKTTYENGTSIYVNYTNSDYVADGMTIGARSYQVGGATK